jgi:uroporphyrinogen III methyltransferase/synthase
MYSISQSNSLFAEFKKLTRITVEGVNFFLLFLKKQRFYFREPFAINFAFSKIEKSDGLTSAGKVWLVGFGPGDPELLTIKGYKLILKADIIFYDDLLNKDFLLKFQAQKVYVGKRKGNHSIEQSEINKLLFEAAISGKTVIRLKGGDPMLFAHGGEEIEYLEQRHIEVGVVPGITAALAAAAFTHIPLTHRGISSSVSFITGHTNRDLNVPLSGTLVYYMGASNLRNIAEAAVTKGWLPDTPVLLVYNVSGNDQEEYYTTLQKAIDTPGNYKTPLIIIIGEVVRLKQNRTVRNINHLSSN